MRYVVGDGWTHRVNTLHRVNTESTNSTGWERVTQLLHCNLKDSEAASHSSSCCAGLEIWCSSWCRRSRSIKQLMCKGLKRVWSNSPAIEHQRVHLKITSAVLVQIGACEAASAEEDERILSEYKAASAGKGEWIWSETHMSEYEVRLTGVNMKWDSQEWIWSETHKSEYEVRHTWVNMKWDLHEWIWSETHKSEYEVRLTGVNMKWDSQEWIWSETHKSEYEVRLKRVNVKWDSHEWIWSEHKKAIAKQGIWSEYAAALAEQEMRVGSSCCGTFYSCCLPGCSPPAETGNC
jgi:hypothetical protein